MGSALMLAWPELPERGGGGEGGRCGGRWGEGQMFMHPYALPLLSASHPVGPGDLPSRSLQTWVTKREAQSGTLVKGELRHLWEGPDSPRLRTRGDLQVAAPLFQRNRQEWPRQANSKRALLGILPQGDRNNSASPSSE